MIHVLTLIFSSLSKNPASSVDQPASFEVRTLIAIDWSDIVSVDPGHLFGCFDLGGWKMHSEIE